MTLTQTFIFATALGLISCRNGGDDSSGTSDVTGTYVREYAIEITNPETGKKIGMRQVRDSIFVVPSDKGYQVSNRKWRMNDYDQEGWVSMAHAEDRPLPTFLASYDENTRSLLPVGENVASAIFLDSSGGGLYKSKAMENGYTKID